MQQGACGSVQIHAVEIKVNAVACIGGVDNLLAVGAPRAKVVDGRGVGGQRAHGVRLVALRIGAIVGNQVELIALVAAHVAYGEQMGRGAGAINLPDLFTHEGELARPVGAPLAARAHAPRLKCAGDIGEEGDAAAVWR